MLSPNFIWSLQVIAGIVSFALLLSIKSGSWRCLKVHWVLHRRTVYTTTTPTTRSLLLSPFFLFTNTTKLLKDRGKKSDDTWRNIKRKTQQVKVNVSDAVDE